MKWDSSLKITDWNKVLSKRSFWIVYHRLFLFRDNWKKIEMEYWDWRLSFLSDIENALDEMQDVFSSPYDFDNEDIEDIFENNQIFLEFPSQYKLEMGLWEGEHFLLHHPDFDEPILIGRSDAHPLLPIFRIEELIFLRNTLIEKGNIPFDAKYLDLFLLKMSFRSEKDVNRLESLFIQDAWKKTDLFEEEEIEYFVSVYDNLTHWEEDSEWGWVCNSKHSLRKKDKEEAIQIKIFLEIIQK